MPDEIDLLKITKYEDSTSLTLSCKEEKDFDYVAFTLCSLFREHPYLFKLIQVVMLAAATNEDLAREVDNACVEIPDFNELLKNIKK